MADGLGCTLKHGFVRRVITLPLDERGLPGPMRLIGFRTYRSN